MRHINTFLLASILLITGCQQELLNTSNSPVEIESVSMTAHDFEVEGTNTRTKLSIDNSGAKFAWSSNDIVGVFPDLTDATQVRFPIKDGDIQDGQNTTEANFTGNGWAVMKANNYMAYYPFVPDMELDKKAIAVDFSGQTQTGNNSSSHLNKYDHMAAKPTEPSSNGNIAFDFNHLGALLQLNLKVPKKAEYTSLTLSCEGVPFVTKGKVDITSNTPCITPTETSHDFTISLSNFTTTETNQTVTIYAMVPPVDMSNQTIHIKIKGPHAEFKASFKRGENKPFVAGSAYRPTIGDPEGGDVDMLEDGILFNQAIKTLANGEEYIYEKKDYLIKHIVFQSNAGSTQPTLPHVDVSSSGTEKPIYASWDSSTGTMYITSETYKVYANTDAQRMFTNLAMLESIDMSDFSTSNTEYVFGIFEGCEKLQSLNLSSWDLSKIWAAPLAFSGCKKLNTITWPANATFTKEKTLFLSEMFTDCESMESINLGFLKGCKVGTLGFSGCTKLKTIDFSEIDMSPCSGSTYMFQNCSSLKTLDVSGFGWQNLTQECVNLFAGCTSLESIDLGNFTIPNAGRFDGTFSNCSSLTTINYTNFSVNAESYVDFFKNCSSLNTIDVSHFVTSRTKNLMGMFSGCSSLTSLDLSSWNTSEVTNMERVFEGCSSLQSLDLSSLKPFATTTMKEMLRSCSGLESVTFGNNFYTEKVNDMSGMFWGCSKLTSIDLSKFNTSKVLSFENMFLGCQALTSFTWGSNFDTHYAENFYGMFADCKSIATLDLSFFNMSSSTNICNMFCGCEKLNSLNIASFTSAHTDDVQELFKDCKKLSVIRMGNDFNPVKFSGTFSNCASENSNQACTIYCSQTFMNNLAIYKSNSYIGEFDPTKVTWKNISTNAQMTFPN